MATPTYVVIPNFTYKGNPVYGAVPAPTYKLSPLTVTYTKNLITVSGSGPGFLNVEVWDASNKVLLQMTPDVFGNFSGTIDTTAIAAGVPTWTVNAWDSLPGQPYQNTASVTFAPTITH